MSACDNHHRGSLSHKQLVEHVCGNYVGKYAGGTEYFTVVTNGSFSQKFFIDNTNVYQLDGKWSLQKGDDKYYIKFEPFMDLNGMILKTGAVERDDAMTATFYDDESIIWFFRDADYFATKQSGAN
jgi:hypothetical protein